MCSTEYGQTGATFRVFNIPELREKIVVAVGYSYTYKDDIQSLKHLFNLNGVSRAFHDTLNTSPRLRHEIFRCTPSTCKLHKAGLSGAIVNPLLRHVYGTAAAQCNIGAKFGCTFVSLAADRECWPKEPSHTMSVDIYATPSDRVHETTQLVQSWQHMMLSSATMLVKVDACFIMPERKLVAYAKGECSSDISIGALARMAVDSHSAVRGMQNEREIGLQSGDDVGNGFRFGHVSPFRENVAYGGNLSRPVTT